MASDMVGDDSVVTPIQQGHWVLPVFCILMCAAYCAALIFLS